MTPRTVTGHSSSNNDFARQVAEHKRATLGQPPTKKFRSNAAPKGTKLGAGYQDRAALLRQQQEDGDWNGNEDGSQGRNDKAKRIKALEDMVKLQQIDQATFEKLRDEIGVGGDLGSTHLIKGLDRRLLERVRKGEDVTATAVITTAEEEVNGETGENGKADIDEELETMLEKEVQAAKREESVKKGEMAAPSSSTVLLEKMSRNEILKRLKADRAAAAAEAKKSKSAEPALGSKFRKLESGDRSEKKKFVETVDGRRREVLVVTNADGTTKRKVKWIDKGDIKQAPQGSVRGGQAIGMEVPAEIAAKHKAMLERQKLEEGEDDDIFTGVGADYNPLGAGADESDEDSQSETSGDAASTQGATEAKPAQTGGKPRNYFSTTIDEEEMKSRSAPAADPSILAALKRAAAIRRSQEDTEVGKEAPETEHNLHGKDFLERLRKREREDAADLDLGFGESRFGDEEDEEKGPLCDGEEGGKKNDRKRGSKKRKGNKEEVSDVTAVLGRGKK